MQILVNHQMHLHYHCCLLSRFEAKHCSGLKSNTYGSAANRQTWCVLKYHFRQKLASSLCIGLYPTPSRRQQKFICDCSTTIIINSANIVGYLPSTISEAVAEASPAGFTALTVYWPEWWGWVSRMVRVYVCLSSVLSTRLSLESLEPHSSTLPKYLRNLPQL